MDTSVYIPCIHRSETQFFESCDIVAMSGGGGWELSQAGGEALQFLAWLGGGDRWAARNFVPHGLRGPPVGRY